MIRQGAVDAFDTAVLCSGDADHAPALEALRDLGKPVWVATFGSYGLSRRLRSSAFGHIDLEPVLQHSTMSGDIDSMHDEQGSAQDEDVDVVAAVQEAQDYFGQGRYVGLSMFSRDWRSTKLPHDPSERQRSIQDAIDAGLLDVYDAADGRKAVRVALPPDGNLMGVEKSAVDDDIGNRMNPAEQAQRDLNDDDEVDDEVDNDDETMNDDN